MAPYSPLFKISPYKARMYTLCPAQYRWEYIERRKDLRKPKPYLTLGEHVHNALKDFFRYEPEKRTREVLDVLFQAYWRTKRGPEGGFASMEQEERYKAKALGMLDEFFRTQDLGAKPVLTEDLYEMPLGPGLALLGRIDRADPEPDGSLRVLDYKTGRYSERRSDKDDAQLLAYALLVEHKLKRKVSKVAYLYLAACKVVETVPSPEGLELVRQDFIRTSRTILQAHRDGAFPALPNALCPWCFYLEICQPALDAGKQPAPLEEETEEF